jgi:hypothetical protein
VTCTAPSCANRRLAGWPQAVRHVAPKLGGSFAVWGGLFSAFDCTLVAVRKKVRWRCRYPPAASALPPSNNSHPVATPASQVRTCDARCVGVLAWW